MSAPVVTLLPCPFCGGSEVSVETSREFSWTRCMTGACGVEGPVVVGGKLEAIAAWNTRTSAEAASAATVAELVEALEGFVDGAGVSDDPDILMIDARTYETAVAILARAKATEQGVR